MTTHQSTEERFVSKVYFPPCVDDCWLWTAATSPREYGHFYANGKITKAHRFSYELYVAAIPDGLELDHLCRNHRCVNPSHLEPVTHQENVRRGVAGVHLAIRERTKTHCPHGHPYDLFNTHNGTDGARHCRECDRLRHKARRAKS